MVTSRSEILFAAVCLACWGSAVTRPAARCLAGEGRIIVRIIDESGESIPARAWVEAAGERLFEPASGTATPYRKDRSFSCDGSFTMGLPAGEAVVYVERGKEFIPVDLAVTIEKEETIERTIPLKRWIDMPARGWYSADLHVHFGHNDPRVLRQLALADDVHLIPSFTYWLRGRGETWNATWPEDVSEKPLVIDGSHLITRNNIEVERIEREAAPGTTIGATFLFNLRQPVTAARYGAHFPTDAELCRVARQQSPAAVFDSDKPSWAETVIGAALGQLDTVQVCHNHYHRLTTIPGGHGMIGPLGPGESNAAAGDGLFHRTNAMYYRFLNCGFRLGVSGGSAIGVMALPAGYNRVYARIDGPLTAEKMWAAIKTGRTFATSGPMLTLSANQEEIGTTLATDSENPRPVSVQTGVQSIDGLETLQIVHNGRVVASRNLRRTVPDPVTKVDMEVEITPARSGWVASRALYRAPDGLLRQAHTSPIYIEVDEKPAASASAARYMLRWIDRLAEVAASQPGRFPDADAQQAVLATYAEARTRYEQCVADAQLHWGDE